MPAKNTKPAAKKPAAKPAKKAPSKPAGKPKSKPSPVKKAPSKPAAKPKSKPAPAKKPAPKKSAPKPVKKAPAKSAPKKAVAKKPAPKPAAKKPAPAAKAAPAKKPAPAKKVAPVKAAPAAKAAKPAAEAPEKKAAAPAPAPVPAPKAEKKASKSSKTAKPDVSHLAKPRSVAAPTARAKKGNDEDEGATIELAKGPVKMTPFLKTQNQRLIELRDMYLNAIEGVANETIRGGGADASAFGMHQADAGSDAYDRDFALSLLGKEQDALYEINQALKRIETGTYGLCEGTGDRIPEERLEAMPFARFTVAYQEKIEQQNRHGGWNRPVHSLFGLDDPGDASDDDKDEDEAPASSRKNDNAESLDFNKE